MYTKYYIISAQTQTYFKSANGINVTVVKGIIILCLSIKSLYSIVLQEV